MMDADGQTICLPKGWSLVRIKDIGNVITGTTPSTSFPAYYGKDFPFFKPTDLNAGYFVKHSEDGLSAEGIKKARLVPAESTLVTCIGATIGKTGYIRKDGACNQQINAIIPKNGMLSEFIYFFCISPRFQKSILENASSTTLPILNKSKFQELPIPVPPLPEQHRIVSKIEELFTKLDAGVEDLKKAKARLRRYRQAILKAAMNGNLTKAWRSQQVSLDSGHELLMGLLEERQSKWKEKIASKALNTGQGKSQRFSSKYKQPLAPEISDGVGVPHNWTFATADQCTSMITDGEHITPERSESGVLLLSARNILDGSISLEKVDYVPDYVF